MFKKILFLLLFSRFLLADSYVFEDKNNIVLFDDGHIFSTYTKKYFDKSQIFRENITEYYKKNLEIFKVFMNNFKAKAKKIDFDFHIRKYEFFHCMGYDETCLKELKDLKDEGFFKDKRADFYIDRVFYVNYLKDDLISICNYSGEYLGGAHDNIAYSCQSYLGKKLLDEGIFTDFKAFIALVAKELLKEENNINIFEEIKADIKANKNFLSSKPSFYENGIVVHFPPYSIAPWSDGEIIVFIHKSDLKGILKDEYFKYFKKEQK